MSSIDVIHSFWVPDFRAKFDVFPNRYTSIWFEPLPIKGKATLPDSGGWKKWAGTPYEDHWVFCAEYCGSNHSEMWAVLRVVPPKVYHEIIEDWATPRGAPWEVGKALYKIKGCVSCHTVDGSRNVGPSWKDLYNSEQPITGMSAHVRADPEYIRESIYNPGAKIVQGYPNQMTTYQGKVKPEELEAIIAYMKTISKFTPQAELDAMKGGEAGGTGATGATGATGGTGGTGNK
jgi:cytochrome c oxidase subunit 2